MHDQDTAAEVLTFTHKAHPQSMPWAVVYGRALVRPIAACMLPVMILTLVAVLEGMQILPGLVWATAGALLTASAWTSFRLQRDLAEIMVASEMAGVRTVSEVLNDVRVDWQPVLDVRDYGKWAYVAIGFGSYEIERGGWECYDELMAALKSSYRAARLSE